MHTSTTKQKERNKMSSDNQEFLMLLAERMVLSEVEVFSLASLLDDNENILEFLTNESEAAK
jgi:hypothetical protein